MTKARNLSKFRPSSDGLVESDDLISSITVVGNASTATYASDSGKLNGQLPSYYATVSALAAEASDRATADASTLSSANTYTDNKVALLVNTAPAALDTLNELAAALGNDPNFATTISTSLGGKQATLVSGTNIKTVNGVSLLGAGDVSVGVTTFNSRSGAVTLSSADVTGALGYTPYNSTNPSGYITSSASITGNAATATKLATPRTIALTGELSGSASFDGSSNISIATTFTPAKNILTEYSYVTTAGQTVISGNDTTGKPLSYGVGSIIVTMNGVILDPTNDYVATSGISITLTLAASAGDELIIYAFSVFDSVNVYALGDTRYPQLLNSYSDPAWITSLNYSKLVGTVPTWNQNTTGNAATATTLATGRTIGMTGDVSWTSTAFNGSANVTGTATLANSGVTAGSYGNATNIPAITVDAKGRITNVVNTAVSIPSGSLTFTGDVTGSGSTGSSTALTLANSGVTAGTYRSVTVDAKGRVTTGSNPTTVAGYGITDMSSQSVSYATTAGSAPASDVYAWAKAATKPSYTYSEVGAPSTTGTNASGTWSISISGNATNISAYTINQNLGTGDQVRFDSVITGNNGNGTNFRIGDDAWIGDINVANTFRVQGNQDASNGYIVFGNSDTTALGRSGAGALTYGGNTLVHSGNIGSYSTGLGIGQSYTLFTTAQRVIGTTYTNTTGKPIWVYLGHAQNGSNTVTRLYVNGVQAGYSFEDTYARGFVCGVVPDGASYYITSGVTTSYNWSELR